MNPSVAPKYSQANGLLLHSLERVPIVHRKAFIRREQLCVLGISNSRKELCMTLTAPVYHEHSCQLCPIGALLILCHGFSASFFNRSIIVIQEPVPLTCVYIDRRRVQMQRHPGPLTSC